MCVSIYLSIYIHVYSCCFVDVVFLFCFCFVFCFVFLLSFLFTSWNSPGSSRPIASTTCWVFGRRWWAPYCISRTVRHISLTSASLRWALIFGQGFRVDKFWKFRRREKLLEFNIPEKLKGGFFVCFCFFVQVQHLEIEGERLFEFNFSWNWGEGVIWVRLFDVCVRVRSPRYTWHPEWSWWRLCWGIIWRTLWMTRHSSCSSWTRCPS